MLGDGKILKELAKDRKRLIESTDNEARAQLWRNINDLKTTRPPVLIYQVPWSEFSDREELVLQCNDRFLRTIEESIRRDIYRLRHFPADRVFLNVVECPAVIYDSNFGLGNRVDIIRSGHINSQHFTPVINEPEDIYKMKEAVVIYDREETGRRLELLGNIFEGICDVELVGKKGLWFTPWDYLISRTGVTQSMVDLIERPDFVNSYVSRYVDLALNRMEKFRKLGLWSSNNGNAIVGSGGYGYVSDLDDPPSPNMGVPTNQLWGCGNAQMFSEVSPSMHWEFSLRHEMRWLENFGMNYYGCCEQLHLKIDILDRIPNLRKISMSPWADLDVAREKISGRYVMSIKPTPTAVAMEPFDEDVIRREFRSHLKKTAGNPTEFILKDISTVKGRPERLDAWDRIVREEIDRVF